MENRINHICSLTFIKLADVIRYEDNFDGTATIEASATTTLPIHAGSGRMTVTGGKTNGNEIFQTQITARLKEVIPTRCHGLILVEVCGDATYIIGSDDLPVHLEATYGTTSKTLRISHENLHIPLKTA